MISCLEKKTSSFILDPVVFCFCFSTRNFISSRNVFDRQDPVAPARMSQPSLRFSVALQITFSLKLQSAPWGEKKNQYFLVFISWSILPWMTNWFHPVHHLQMIVRALCQQELSKVKWDIGLMGKSLGLIRNDCHRQGKGTIQNGFVSNFKSTSKCSI